MKMALYPNSNKFILLFAVAFAALLIQGCTLDGISSENNQEQVTEADLEAAGKILGESLSDENDGVMASMNDALTTVSSSGFAKATTVSPETPTVQNFDDDSNSGRGTERNFSYHYDPVTGTHTVIFTRIVYNGEFFKSVKDTLKYIFTDNNNQFIEFPREQAERIETIDFKASRDGIIETPTRESNFARRDTFFIDGVSAASTILEVDGVHHGKGEMSVNDENANLIQRSYTSRIEFLDINIDKGVVGENGSLEHGVTGTLIWEITISHSSSGSSETKTISGTIEMNGDGTALLRFKRFAKLFLINLDDGNVRDYTREFEGRVKRVNLDQSTFTLANGRAVRITDNTEIDAESDVHSLEGIAQALERGALVYADGSGFVREEIFVASEVKFKVDENDEEHFDGRVTDIDLNSRTVTVGEDLTVRLGEESVISGSSEIGSLEDAKEFLEAGKEVFIAGYGALDAESDALLLALEIKFEVEEVGEEGFEGTVISVDTENQLVTLGEELVLRIGENSIISGSGDLHTLAQVSEALGSEQNVIGFGEAVPDPEVTEAEWLIIEIKFVILD